MLRSRVSYDSRTTSRALRKSVQISSTPGALPQRSFLTTLETSALKIEDPVPNYPGPASLPEGVSVRRLEGLQSISFTNPQRPKSKTVAVHCFPLLKRRMVVQNLFKAVEKSLSMASPNSSHDWIFASATAVAALCLACQ